MISRYAASTLSLGATLKRAYSRLHRMTEVTAIGSFWVLAFGLGWQLYHTLDGAFAWSAAVISVGLGYAFADLVSGIVHWLADRYGSEHTPILGANYIRPFREHHTDPTAITRHDFIETNGSNCIISAPCMAAVLLIETQTPDAIAPFLLATTLSFCLAIFGTNQFHKWAHMANAPRPARALVSLSLILAPDHHEAHHAAPFDRNYCITTGWWNPFLRRLRIFERGERFIEIVTGARPHASAARAESEKLESDSGWETC